MKRLPGPERAAYGLALLLAAGAFLAAGRFPGAAGSFSGPGSVPRFLCFALAALAVAGLLRRRGPDAPGERADGRRVLVLTGLSAAYLLLMPVLGFISGTALLCAALLRALGCRDPVRALAAGFVAAFALYGLFGGLMQVALPRGWIG